MQGLHVNALLGLFLNTLASARLSDPEAFWPSV